MGLGLMGHGIGLVSAQAGYEVVAVEAKPEALEAGKQRIAGSLKKLLSKVRLGLRGCVGFRVWTGPLVHARSRPQRPKN